MRAGFTIREVDITASLAGYLDFSLYKYMLVKRSYKNITMVSSRSAPTRGQHGLAPLLPLAGQWVPPLAT